MDLVDIDKVLDSLELNEEDCNNEGRTAVKHLQIFQPANICPLESRSASSADFTHEEAVRPSDTFQTGDSTAGGDRVNKFVGVSQVFSSLYEYRKNVENLEADLQLHKGGDENNCKDVTDQSDKLENRTGDFVVDEDIEINNYVGSDDDQKYSSNSITTSSSSTFSSGPSPTLLSSDSPPSPDERSHIKPKDNNVPTESLNQNTHRSDFDDLAVGLSSISLTNQGSTLSSAAGSSRCISKIDHFSSSLSLSESSKIDLISEESERHLSESQNVNDSQVLQESNSQLDNVNVPVQPASCQNVMVAFGSTMDEISDTELDSILQEIESELPLQTSVEATIPDDSKTNIDVKHEGNIDCNVQTTLSPENIKTTTDNLSCPSKFDDAMNIDSFSQASTIEFADDRSHEDDIENCIGAEEIDDDNGQKHNCQQNTSQKRQRPTTLDLSARKSSLYATAGQTPPGSRLYERAIPSSEEDTPESGAAMQSPDKKSISSDLAQMPVAETPILNTGLQSAEPNIRISHGNTDESMMPTVDCANLEAGASVQNMESEENKINPNLGKVPPVWVPDNEAVMCMQCDIKFTLLKRRHHCRACGQVLCSICCSQKIKLEFLSNPESRVCVQCFLILTKHQHKTEPDATLNTATPSPLLRTPNPNNPMEYCSTIPPHRQVNPQAVHNPTVIVPVGVLKKEGNPKRSRKRKSVMFSDGIRPGSDLASLDGKWSDAKHARPSVSTGHSSTEQSCSTPNAGVSRVVTRNSTQPIPQLDGGNSFIPQDEHLLPPICISCKSEEVYQEVPNNADLIKRLHNESLKFVVQTNFYVFVKISHLKCCINKTVINFTTCGLHHVGNDEIIILLELGDSDQIPRDVFVHLNEIYWEASKGRPTKELGFSIPKDLIFLGSREHGGFLFIRSTFQCLQDVHVPESPFLIGVLIHRWEVPWAKIFPLRLMLRLGAQYRYYPSPHISVRNREPVYAEIAQTIINLLADFRNYTYTLPTIKGMYIHMEDRRTNILIPRNRHDEIMKTVNNSSDHILAMGGNFSKKADGHLVCIQNMDSDSAYSNCYTTQAINIQGQPRKVTGASFFVLNEALKTTSGLSGKCSIIEDGLMVQILPSKMNDIRNALLNMKDIEIVCGPIEGGEQHTEIVYIQWVEDDTDLNIGVKSPIDAKQLDGIPSIRVHSGFSLSNASHTIKWTEVFLLEVPGDNTALGCKPPVDISNVSEQIAKNASAALFPFLDLLSASGNTKIGLRVTLNQDNVCYECGSQHEKFPPLYMNALDNELIPTLHKQSHEIGKNIVLELIFYILNV